MCKTTCWILKLHSPPSFLFSANKHENELSAHNNKPLRVCGRATNDNDVLVVMIVTHRSSLMVIYLLLALCAVFFSLFLVYIIIVHVPLARPIDLMCECFWFDTFSCVTGRRDDGSSGDGTGLRPSTSNNDILNYVLNELRKQNGMKRARARAIIFINSFMCVCFSRRVYLLFAGVAVDADIFCLCFVCCCCCFCWRDGIGSPYLNNILHTHEMCGYEWLR